MASPNKANPTPTSRDVISWRLHMYMNQWSAQVRGLAAAKAATMRRGKRDSYIYKTGKKAGKTEQKLKTHIQYKITADSGEFEGVGFKFPVHGIFREYGVGNGTPRRLVNISKRTMNDWLSSTLQEKEEKLLNTVAEYQSGKVIREYMGVKK